MDDHVLLPLHSLCALDALRAPPPASPPPPAGSVAGAFAALAAQDEFFDGPLPPPPPAAVVLRLWWRTSELLGQWDSAQRYACNPMRQRLQRHATEAATPCDRGCNPV